jgi:hypothetical protein
MFTDKKQILIATALAIVPALLQGPLFPFLRLTFLSPLLVLLFYRLSWHLATWVAVAGGVLMDLLSADGQFGLHALIYAMTAFLLYPLRHHFFEEKLTTIPLLSSFFGLLSALLFSIVGSLFERPITLSLTWIATDLLILPIADGCWAFVWFLLPLFYLSKYTTKEPRSSSRPR